MADGPHDPLPAMIAGIDQMISTAPQLARGAYGLFTAFVGEGFTEPQALHLTISILTANLGGGQDAG